MMTSRLGFFKIGGGGSVDPVLNVYTRFSINSNYVGLDITTPEYIANFNLNNIPSANVFWTKVYSNGGNIQVWNADFTQRFDIELVNFDKTLKTGRLYIRFKSTTITSAVDTVFNVTLDDTQLNQPAHGDPFGIGAVWTDYVQVRHLDGNLYDSKNNVTRTAMYSSVFNYNNQKLESGIITGLSDYSISTNPEVELSKVFKVYIKSLTSYSGLGLVAEAAPSFGVTFSIRGNALHMNNALGDGNITLNYPSALPTFGTRFKATVHSDKTGNIMYVDGVPFMTGTTIRNNAAREFRMGYEQGGEGARNEVELDEVRVRNVTESDNYELTEYKNDNETDFFIYITEGNY